MNSLAKELQLRCRAPKLNLVLLQSQVRSVTKHAMPLRILRNSNAVQVDNSDAAEKVYKLLFNK